MPTISLPAGSSTQLEPRPAHQQHLRSFAVHAYLGIAVTLVIITIWYFKPRRRSSAPNSPTYRIQSDNTEVKVSLGVDRLVKPVLTERFYPTVSNPHSVLPRHSPVADFSRPISRAHPKGRRDSRYQQEMDQDGLSHTSDGSDPTTTSSHNVSRQAKSTSSSKNEAYLWLQSFEPVSMTERSSLDQLRQTTPLPNAVSPIDGRRSLSSRSEENRTGKGHPQTQQPHMSQARRQYLSSDGSQTRGDGLHGMPFEERKLRFTKPPPPPPLTPPTLDKVAANFHDSRRIDGTSPPQNLSRILLDQPNLDYIGHPSSVATPDSSPSNATTIPRRTSYTKIVPVGIPTPSSSSSSSSATTVTSLSGFRPSSHRQSSPSFPSPPQVPDGYQFVGGHMGHRSSDRGQDPEGIEVHGKILTVTDENSDGWRRPCTAGIQAQDCVHTSNAQWGKSLPDLPAPPIGWRGVGTAYWCL
ncbi:hypothetical protein B0T20DRAFT_104119 [Sordaria brevicollis]|uniref:Uncharacterized protein n=1 Tax=Sordaria brevicollis TaxID=83679 RepID=A0AAE0NVE7_SORBR|nr:hypothetical protein B0T20DRAFT_104119 [Sordaria brevicollis]